MASLVVLFHLAPLADTPYSENTKKTAQLVRISRMTAALIDHLTAFIEVAETGSFAAAARNLRRGVSSVSYSIAQVEEKCGFPLLVRGNKKSELTERGRAVFADAKAVVEGARRFTSHAATLQRGAETRIRIAVDALFPPVPLQSALKRLTDRHDRIRIQLFNSSLNNLWDELRTRRLDFALTLISVLPLDMEGMSFRQIQLAPVAAANHRLSLLKRPLQMSDLQRERQIYFVASPDLDTERVGRVFSLDVWTANDLEHIRRLVRGGLGWSFGSEDFFAEEILSGAVQILASKDAHLHPVRTIGAVWLANNRPGPMGRDLIALIAEALGKNNP